VGGEQARRARPGQGTREPGREDAKGTETGGGRTERGESGQNRQGRGDRSGLPGGGGKWETSGAVEQWRSGAVALHVGRMQPARKPYSRKGRGSMQDVSCALANNSASGGGVGKTQGGNVPFWRGKTGPTAGNGDRTASKTGKGSGAAAPGGGRGAAPETVDWRPSPSEKPGCPGRRVRGPRGRAAILGSRPTGFGGVGIGKIRVCRGRTRGVFAFVAVAVDGGEFLGKRVGSVLVGWFASVLICRVLPHMKFGSVLIKCRVRPGKNHKNGNKERAKAVAPHVGNMQQACKPYSRKGRGRMQDHATCPARWGARRVRGANKPRHARSPEFGVAQFRPRKKGEFLVVGDTAQKAVSLRVAFPSNAPDL
jgi:hypothetical protein